MTDILRTRPEDVAFHRTRRMFCLADGDIKVAPEGVAMSHLEWFEAEGWMGAADEEFIDRTVRGMFLPERHAIFLYRGRGFFFDEELIAEAKRQARQLQTVLTLDSHILVYAGPADAVVHGTRYEQRLLGTIESLAAEAVSSAG